MIWRLLICNFFLFFIGTCLGMRDPFLTDDRVINESALNRMLVADLSFVGTVALPGNAIGFVEDPLGNLYQLKIGQKLGPCREEVMDILQDKIILTNGHHYTIIKYSEDR
jgi:hypothetical protein